MAAPRCTAGESPPDEPLRSLVPSCLDDLDELVDDFLAEIAALEAYSGGPVPTDVLRADAAASLEMLLRTTAQLPVPERLANVCERIGRSRAQLGVPLEALLQAVRLDFRVLWSAFLHRIDSDQLPALVHDTVQVWDVVEEHSGRVHLAYVDEAALLVTEREDERSRTLGALLTSRGGDPRLTAQAAAALGMDSQAAFLLAATPVGAPKPLRRAADRLRSSAVPVHVQSVDGRHVLLAQLPHGSRTAPYRWLESVPCGLGPVADGIADVPRALDIAVEVAAALPEEADGPRGLGNLWAQVAAARLGATGTALQAEVLLLHDVSAPERDRLLSTVRAYLRSGSVGAVTGEVFCHRNTVLNRLQRFTELTGYDVTRPESAAAVVLALACSAER